MLNFIAILLLIDTLMLAYIWLDTKIIHCQLNELKGINKKEN